MSREEVNNFLNRFSNKYIFVLALFLIAIGFSFGRFYEIRNRNSVYLVNEKKLLKLVAVGLALDDKEKSSEDVKEKDKAVVRSTMHDLGRHLGKYKKHPVVIEKRNKGGYELYRGVNQIDITQELIIKLIGKEKWEAIGKEFLQR